MVWVAPSLSPVPRSVTGDIKAWAQQVADLINRLATIANTQAINFDPIMAAVCSILAPGGRLSLSSGAAVQTADVVGGATVYYLPHIHPYLPVVGLLLPAAGVSLALDSNSLHTGYQQSGKNFDLFLYNNAGTLVLGTGNAWTSDTARLVPINQTSVPGIWTNTGNFSLKIDTSAGTITVADGRALYVGTMRATANGQCTMQFTPAAAAGGGSPVMGLFNAYNQVPARCINRDSTASWTYGTATWRAFDNSTSNRISIVDGLGYNRYFPKFRATATCSATGYNIGTNLDSTTATPLFNTQLVVGGQATAIDDAAFIPGLGFHYFQQMEFSGGTASTIYGLFSGNQYNEFSVDMWI